MEVLSAIETEINDLHEAGLLRWLEGEEQEYKLFESNLFLDILKMHGERSKIHSFVINGKDFHFLIYYDENGGQSHARFIWDCESRIEDLCKK